MQIIINIELYYIVLELNKTKIFVYLLLYIYFICFGKRVCLIYNIFKIPCSGCGLTRSIFYLFNKDIQMSLKYNILTIPLILLYTINSIWYLIDCIRNKNTLKRFIEKYKKHIIIVAIILFSISLIKNLNNSLLYNVCNV